MIVGGQMKNALIAWLHHCQGTAQQDSSTYDDGSHQSEPDVGFWKNK